MKYLTLVIGPPQIRSFFAGSDLPTTDWTGEMVQADSVLTDPSSEGTYEPPRIIRLGTLAELTLGTGIGFDDGLNGLNGDGGPSI